MLIAEQFSTMPAVHATTHRVQPLATCWIAALVFWASALPVCFRNDLFGILQSRLGYRVDGPYDGGWLDFIWLKYFQPFELLIEDSQRLEPLRLSHLSFEPIFDFVLLDFLEVLVIVIQVAIQL